MFTWIRSHWMQILLVVLAFVIVAGGIYYFAALRLTDAQKAVIAANKAIELRAQAAAIRSTDQGGALRLEAQANEALADASDAWQGITKVNASTAASTAAVKSAISAVPVPTITNFSP